VCEVVSYRPWYVQASAQDVELNVYPQILSSSVIAYTRAEDICVSYKQDFRNTRQLRFRDGDLELARIQNMLLDLLFAAE
jgi:hypothetical protein